MIKHPSMTTADIVAMMQGGQHGAPRLLDHPQSDADRAAKDARLREIVQDANNIRGVCVACGAHAPMLAMAMCACGGPVCAECQRVEEDGTCYHERPDVVRDDE